jgi:hypothetical protein
MPTSDGVEFHGVLRTQFIIEATQCLPLLVTWQSQHASRFVQHLISIVAIGLTRFRGHASGP